MLRKTLLNLALLVLFAVLATVIYQTEEQSDALNRLSDSSADSINSITIRHNNRHTVMRRDSGQQWRITQPIEIAANSFRVSTLLDLLQAPVHNQYPLAETDTAATGLDNPQTSIQFNEQTIEFGIINPVTRLRYVKLKDQVYTIEDVYQPLITSHFGTLVALELLPAGSNIEKIVLPRLTISRDSNGVLRSDSEIAADSMAATLQHWQQAQAFGVHNYLQRKTLGDIAVYLSGSSRAIRFQVTDDDPWLILARPETGLEYHLEKENYRLLVNPMAD